MSKAQKTLRIGLIVGLGIVVSGCSVLQGKGLSLSGNASVPTFEGERFRGGARPTDRKHPERFSATARNASASLEGARQAAEYYGIKHCINLFGTSDIDWEIGPDTAAEALSLEGNQITFVGTCVEP